MRLLILFAAQQALPEMSADKLTYSFELPEEVIFQNGQKLTAERAQMQLRDTMLDPGPQGGRPAGFSRFWYVDVDSPSKLPVSPWPSPGHLGDVVLILPQRTYRRATQRVRASL